MSFRSFIMRALKGPVMFENSWAKCAKPGWIVFDERSKKVDHRKGQVVTARKGTWAECTMVILAHGPHYKLAPNSLSTLRTVVDACWHSEIKCDFERAFLKSIEMRLNPQKAPNPNKNVDWLLCGFENWTFHVIQVYHGQPRPLAQSPSLVTKSTTQPNT